MQRASAHTFVDQVQRVGVGCCRFTEAVSIKSICVSGGEDGTHPKEIKLYALQSPERTCVHCF